MLSALFHLALAGIGDADVLGIGFAAIAIGFAIASADRAVFLGAEWSGFPAGASGIRDGVAGTIFIDTGQPAFALDGCDPAAHGTFGCLGDSRRCCVFIQGRGDVFWRNGALRHDAWFETPCATG